MMEGLVGVYSACAKSAKVISESVGGNERRARVSCNR